jgi:hypothetical protein
MTTEPKVPSAEVIRVRKELAETRKRIARYKKEHPGEPFPFAKMYGAWRGKVHFTDEDIEAAKIRPREFLEE